MILYTLGLHGLERACQKRPVSPEMIEEGRLWHDIPAAAAIAMLDAIVAVRKPYDEQNRPAAAAKARDVNKLTWHGPASGNWSDGSKWRTASVRRSTSTASP